LYLYPVSIIVHLRKGHTSLLPLQLCW